MFGSEILEVIIGLVFVYVLLSLICSAITEIVAKMFAMRAKTLQNSLKALLGDPANTGLAKALYDHPMVKSLGVGKRRPAYIPSRNFALALFGIIGSRPDGGQPQTFEELHQTVERIENSDVKRLLLSLVDTAGSNLDTAREKVEIWYDDTMERLSGAYRTKAQIVTFLVALLVSISLNADTLMIFNSLSQNATLRKTIVATAESHAATSVQAAAVQPEGSTLQEGETHSRAQLSPADTVDQLRNELMELEVIGWTTAKHDAR